MDLFRCVTLEMNFKLFFLTIFSQNHINVTHLNSINAVYDTPVAHNKAGKRVCSLLQENLLSFDKFAQNMLILC